MTDSPKSEFLRKHCVLWQNFLKIKLIWIKSGNTTQQEQAQWETIVILPAVLKIQLIFYSYFSHATNHWDRMHPGMGHLGVHTFLYSPSSTINPIRNDYRLWILRLFCLIVFECASRRAWCCMYYAMQELYINHWYHLVLPLRKYIELEFLTNSLFDATWKTSLFRLSWIY